MFENSQLRAVIFDLDGTLVETEHLKAEAYARLIADLTGLGEPEPAAVDLYRSKVGATDMVICEAMIERFNLSSILSRNPGESDADALHRQRMGIYRESFGTPARLRTVVYDHNVNLLKQAKSEGLSVAVATMSFSDEARRVIEAIGLTDSVDAVVGVEDVKNPKPAPDAFLLAMDRIGVSAQDALIIEDSPRGAIAAAASGAPWLCVASEFSTEALRHETRLDHRWIVWDTGDLDAAVARRISI